jgi:hypothetical protein
MKKLVIVAFLLLTAGHAFADVLCEDFPDPLGGWKTRWLGTNSDMCNYYVCWGGSGEDERGNNPCGIWVSDYDGDAQTCHIHFNAGFGATVSHIDFPVMAFAGGNITINYGTGSYSTALVADGTFPPCPTNVYSTDTNGGLIDVILSPTGGQIEGNTSVDNVCVTTGGVTPTGACCGTDGTCSITTQADCRGTYQGDGTDCDPDPCHPVPVHQGTWGSIKASYK